MLIEIDISAANTPVVARWLNRILHKVEDGWHLWDTTRGPTPEALLASSWARDPGMQGRRVRQILCAATKHGAWSMRPHGRRIRVTIHPRLADDVIPETAARLAEEPLVILVENRHSDGAFVERIVKELDNGLRNLWRRPGRPIRIDSVGGTGQMPAEVQRRAQGTQVRPRIVGVADSGKRSPEDSPNREARKIDRAFKAADLPCWILAKREAENYLPRVLLNRKRDAGEDHRRTVDAWDDLTPNQKDYYDMKDGLPEEPSGPEAALFADLAIGNRRLLADGFGEGVYKCWMIWNVQAKAELIERGGVDLERGIELIRTEV